MRTLNVKSLPEDPSFDALPEGETKGQIVTLMKPVQIKQKSPTELFIRWDDAHEGSVSLRNLRDACPCAECKGETVLLKRYSAPTQDPNSLGRYLLKSATPIGGYAIKFGWGDGHDLGLYTWEQLRNLCECEVCLKRERS